MLRKRQEASGRARRFPIHIPIRYRLPRSPRWFEAYTENVSRSGVLFRTEMVFEPTTALDFRLQLPPVDNGVRVRGEVVCKGEVVRMNEPEGISPTVAVAIHRYRLEQKREPN